MDRAEDVQENVEVTPQGDSVSTHRERREETLLSEKDVLAKEEKLERETTGKTPNNQEEEGWGPIIEHSRRTQSAPKVKQEYDEKNDPGVWNTMTRQTVDLSRVLEGTLEEISTIARFYRNYESGNIGIPDWVEEAETFPDRRR